MTPPAHPVARSLSGARGVGFDPSIHPRRSFRTYGTSRRFHFPSGQGPAGSLLWWLAGGRSTGEDSNLIPGVSASEIWARSFRDLPTRPRKAWCVRPGIQDPLSSARRPGVPPSNTARSTRVKGFRAIPRVIRRISSRRSGCPHRPLGYPPVTHRRSVRDCPNGGVPSWVMSDVTSDAATSAICRTGHRNR